MAGSPVIEDGVVIGLLGLYLEIDTTCQAENTTCTYKRRARMHTSRTKLHVGPYHEFFA